MDTHPAKNIAPPPAPTPAAGEKPRATAAMTGRASGPRRRGMRGETALANALAYALLLLGTVLFALPFLFMVSTALKSVDEANEFPPRLLPTRPVTVSVHGVDMPLYHLPDGRGVVRRGERSGQRSAVARVNPRGQILGEEILVPVSDLTPVKRLGAHLENFPRSLSQPGMEFGRFFKNTLLIVVFTVFGATLSAALCAYGFARLRFRGREPLFVLLLATMMIPGQVTMIPVYVMFKELRWINTFLPLIVPAWFGGGAFSIFLLRQFFRSIPLEMEEAARMDGASPLATWWRIILPLSLPAMATVAIFTFMGSWNDFMGPLIYLNDTEKFTLALGLNLFKGQYGTDTPHLMMAATLIVLSPVLLLFFFAQKHFIQGIVISGVKG